MLEHHRHPAPPGRKLVDPLPVQPHLAAVGCLEPGDDPEQGRLARARRTEESDELLRRHGQRDVVQNESLAIGLADVAKL